jgi:hypothetical protein
VIDVKSYLLTPIDLESDIAIRLSEILPGQVEPWVLFDDTGDAVAYFNLVENEAVLETSVLQVDISGRHYNEDAKVIAILKRLQDSLGGEIVYAP